MDIPIAHKIPIEVSSGSLERLLIIPMISAEAMLKGSTPKIGLIPR